MIERGEDRGYYDVTCDYCSYGDYLQGNSIHEIAAQIRNSGWDLLRDFNTVLHKCPSCCEQQRSVTKKRIRLIRKGKRLFV